MKRLSVLFALALVAGAAPSLLGQAHPDDQEGCEDHPLFNRMPGYHLEECYTAEFDARTFPIGPPLDDSYTKVARVEGATTFLRYGLNDGASPMSGLQLMRNFQNAAAAGGGTVQGSYPDWCVAYVNTGGQLGDTCTYWGVSMHFAGADKEVWAYMQMTGEEEYGIQIVERAAMNQYIVVTAADLKAGLANSGHVAVYDILFDTGSAQIKPESSPALGEIARLMNENASLKLHVVGHTDNTGELSANMKLSEARAESVREALSNQHGIASSRLGAFGAGPFSPVASNATEEGRAKNRRVELVEQ